MNFRETFLYRTLRNSPLSSLVRDARRFAYVGKYELGRLGRALSWVVSSRETSNFTYELTARNKTCLAQMLAIVTGQPAPVLHGYIAELEADQGLASAIVDAAKKIPRNLSDADETAKYGRRLGWYALARWLKPKVVVETGVDKGLGSMVLCSALKRNAEEGHPGRYIGTDINPDAGALLVPPYRSFGRIVVGDSLASLSALAESVDLFINDSDHSADYERREYEAIGPKLSSRAIILGDNAHVTTELADFSHRQGRSFLFFHEEPLGHWYPGAGIGISFKPAS